MFNGIANNIYNKLKFSNYDVSNSLCNKLDIVFLAYKMAIFNHIVFNQVIFDQIACNYYFYIILKTLYQYPNFNIIADLVILVLYLRFIKPAYLNLLLGYIICNCY